MEQTRYLIIGGGVAGTIAAEEIRARDPQGSIVLVSAEDHPLYSRVLLPNYVKGKIPRAKVFLRSLEQYEKKQIQLICGRIVATLDPATHTVTLDDGIVWQYEKLLLATGGEAAIPESFPKDPRVLPFRTIEDADRIRECIAGAPVGASAAIIGSGFIALEFAPFFADAGLQTHLYMRGPRYWSKRMDPTASQLIEDVFTAHDIVIHRNVAIDSVVAKDDGLHLSASDGSQISVALIGVGVGMHSVPTWAAKSGLTCNEGILTNEYLETNLPDVWAAGDGAEFFDQTVGRQHRLGNWNNADMQGRCAAINMTDARRVFENVSQYSTRIFDTVIAMMGDVSGTSADMLVRDDPATLRHSQLFMRDNRLVGATTINVVTERSAMMTLIKNKTDLSERREALVDSSQPIVAA